MIIETAKEWRCFHCDEVFTDRTEARVHFGREACTDVPAACVDPLRHDEKERFRQLQEAVDHAMFCQAEADKVMEKADTLDRWEDELERLFGECGGGPCRTPHQAWLKLDAANGEILALKEHLAEAEAKR